MTTYRIVLAVIAMFVFFTNLPLYLYDEMGLMIFEAPKHWWLGFAALAAPAIFWRAPSRAVFSSPLLLWCVLYVWVAVIGFFVSSQSDMAWQEVRWRLQGASVLIILFFLFSHSHVLTVARQALAGAVLVGVGMNLFELLYWPLSHEYVGGRSAGLYINANTAAECLVLGMILSVGGLWPTLRVPFLVATGIGVMLTVSRAGILAWGLAVVGLVVGRQVPAKKLVTAAFAGLVLSIILVLPRLDSVLTLLDQKGFFNTNVLERMEWFLDPGRVEDYSSWERRALAAAAWAKITAQPIVGHGTGSYLEDRIPPHNQYLAFMIDHGLLGAILFPLLVLAAIWGAPRNQRLVALTFAGAVLLFGFASHSIVYRENTLLLFSLMAAMAVTPAQDTRRRSLLVQSGRWEWAPHTAGPSRS